jgi:hypothetical protein
MAFHSSLLAPTTKVTMAYDQIQRQGQPTITPAAVDTHDQAETLHKRLPADGRSRPTSNDPHNEGINNSKPPLHITVSRVSSSNGTQTPASAPLVSKPPSTTAAEFPITQIHIPAQCPIQTGQPPPRTPKLVATMSTSCRIPYPNLAGQFMLIYILEIDCNE